MTMIAEPLFTDEVPRNRFVLPRGSTFVYGIGSEEDRAVPSPDWLELRRADTSFVTIVQQGNDSFEARIGQGKGARQLEVFIYEEDSILEFLKVIGAPIYLDITGLTHRTWAPLVRTSIQADMPFHVVYMEPAEYQRDEEPSAGSISNLSDKYEGIEPIPGFARLNSDSNSPPTFVPMIGFEGARLEHILDRTDTLAKLTFPVIGVPGFRPEYAFYAYKGNQLQLSEDFLASRVRYAKANCPFEAFQLLHEIDEFGDRGRLKIAPIGTKPHGLGAVLFAISRGHRVELIYDHPVRSRHRTKGEARMCIYDIPAFVTSGLFGSDR